MTLAWLTIVSGTTDQNVFQASSIAIGEPQRTDTHHEAGLHQMGNPRYSRPDKKKVDLLGRVSKERQWLVSRTLFCSRGMLRIARPACKR